MHLIMMAHRLRARCDPVGPGRHLEVELRGRTRTGRGVPAVRRDRDAYRVASEAGAPGRVPRPLERETPPPEGHLGQSAPPAWEYRTSDDPASPRVGGVLIRGMPGLGVGSSTRHLLTHHVGPADHRHRRRRPDPGWPVPRYPRIRFPQLVAVAAAPPLRVALAIVGSAGATGLGLRGRLGNSAGSDVHAPDLASVSLSPSVGEVSEGRGGGHRLGRLSSPRPSRP
jgi:hypothetical protein